MLETWYNVHLHGCRKCTTSRSCACLVVSNVLSVKEGTMSSWGGWKFSRRTAAATSSSSVSSAVDEKDWSRELSVLMLCVPEFMLTSGSSAPLGRPRCGLSIRLSLLVMFNRVCQLFSGENGQNTKILEGRHFRMIWKWPPMVTRRAKVLPFPLQSSYPASSLLTPLPEEVSRTALAQRRILGGANLWGWGVGWSLTNHKSKCWTAW